MSTALDDRCARCGGAFYCGMTDDGPCVCAGVTLDADTLADLRQRYRGCLCGDCLRSLAAGASPGPSSQSNHRA
jgi:hypothetical protein